MERLCNNLFVVAVVAVVAGILAVSVPAVGAMMTPAAETSEPVTYSEPSWTNTSTLVIGGYETPSPDMIATAPPLSDQ
jgi:hypothetical protein